MEFAILGGVAVLTVLAVVQLAVFLFQRNVVVTAVAEGSRVGATFGRGAKEARETTCELIRQAIGERCDVLRVTAVERAGLVVVTADGALPALSPVLPALRIHHTAITHDEEALFDDEGVRPGPISRRDAGSWAKAPRAAGSWIASPRAADAQAADPRVAGSWVAGSRPAKAPEGSTNSASLERARASLGPRSSFADRPGAVTAATQLAEPWSGLVGRPFGVGCVSGGRVPSRRLNEVLR